MTRFEVEIHDDAMSIINKIKNLDESGIDLVVPEGSILFENILNLRIIEKEAERLGKTIHFETKDKNGTNLLIMLREQESSEFTSKKIDITTEEEIQTPSETSVKRKRIRLPKFVGISNPIKGRKSKWLKIFVIILILLGGIAFASNKLLTDMHEANVKVVVKSQPLTKSVEIKVIKDGNVNSAEKTIKGYEISTILNKTGTIETTGEEIIGENAKGEIKIFNKTQKDKKFEKGHKFSYEKDDKDLVFVLTEDVTVSKGTEDEDTLVFTPGSAAAKVKANDIGDKYNIDEGKSLDVDDYDDDEVAAKTKNDFSGGKSETVSIVTQEDLDTLSNNTYQETADNIESELMKKVSTNEKYISGSLNTTLTKENFSAEVGDEEDSVEVIQEITVTGLTYSEKDLEHLLDGLLDEFVPEGFVLSTKDRDIKVEILGNSDSAILSDTESDLQVTIKTFVVTDIQQDTLINELLGKSLSDAERVLGGIKNIQTYELEIVPNIPILQKMPSIPEKIILVIEKE